ncbi:MAG TPA: 6-aminohexanoate hydrolase, partial [Bacillus sp. (in: Bacteria)]|nr:6-aminohexanoate hydrolase [Bacillus sp. (in: firmicutes)]
HLLSYIIQEATGMSTERFAKKYLFDPLKINEYEWQQDPQGIY